jgi:CRISPR-associated protein Cmr3
VLRGEVPVAAELCPSSDLWCDESRIGLERDAATRTAREGMLYSARHVRLKRDVSLGVRVHGVPATWSTPFGRFVPLGGESRLAEVIEWRGDFSIDMPMDKIRKSGRVMVVALTPLDLDPEIVVGRRPLSEVGDATVVSACLPRLLRIGGWDSLTRRPLPVRSVMAPGSVLFCKASDPFRLNVLVKNDGLARVGSRTAQGFGVVAFGSWDDEMEEMT